MPFRTDLISEYDADRELLTLVSPLIYYSNRHRCEIVVPEGFESDGASIPVRLVSFIGLHPFSDALVEAACLHDCLYRDYALTRPNNKWTRKEIDQIFYDAIMDEGKIGWVRAQIVWKAVRIAGDPRAVPKYLRRETHA